MPFYGLQCRNIEVDSVWSFDIVLCGHLNYVRLLRDAVGWVTGSIYKSPFPIILRTKLLLEVWPNLK